MWSLPYTTKAETLSLLKENSLLTKKVGLALNQAIKSHSRQKRDSGKPYLEEHIYPIVASVVKKYKKKIYIEDLLIICILHDVVEDDVAVSVDKLREIFGDKVISCVLYLTKTPSENSPNLSQEEKIKINKGVLEKIKKAPKLAQITKLEDRLSNITCIESLSNPKFVRYVQETKDSYVPFAKYVKQFIYADLLEEQIKRIVVRVVEKK